MNYLAVLCLVVGIVLLCGLFRLRGASRSMALVLVLLCASGFLVLGHLVV